MYKIEHYKIAWNTKTDEGIFILDTPDGVERIHVDSAMEARLLLDKLRSELKLYRSREVFLSSFEPLDIPEPPKPEPEEDREIIWEQVSWVIPKKEKEVSRATKPKKVSPKKQTTPSTTQKTIKATTDKLRLIEGVGPKIEGLLHDVGILSFKDLAQAKQATLQEVLDKAGTHYQMHDPGTWSEQAALAAEGKMKALKAWQDKLKGGKASKK